MILPLCYCTEHDQPHVHLPAMRDGQYGLSIEVDDPPAPEAPTPGACLHKRVGEYEGMGSRCLGCGAIWSPSGRMVSPGASPEKSTSSGEVGGR